MANVQNQEIFDLLSPVVADAGLYLEAVKVVRAGKHTSVRVIVDLESGPGGVGTDVLGDVTRAISVALDEADPVNGAYTLEVSTPGAERKLTEPRHFSRAIGHLSNVNLESEHVQGRVLSVGDDKMVLRIESKGAQEREIPLSQVRSAKVVLELKKPEGE
ncbi:ribosome maturation factor RimP [Arcanobacterium wilhelmae]|uniref:Ribosome maturation factor RimP n=1 Tax=Arcanobacterium wilhelmae TaxID=1803177 RepID=A0ABT9N9C2_9ACTO|nr:ribosome maturation factor RimP [Arcanobacterium wilhelmae]MDP9800302.1 ribosome maturation factor RimP [Arcanobacterium wilhelmae]WFN89740.1 ribosome maturation factor RimP [Arcanobacterium wilhelmae]